MQAGSHKPAGFRIGSGRADGTERRSRRKSVADCRAWRRRGVSGGRSPESDFGSRQDGGILGHDLGTRTRGSGTRVHGNGTGETDAITGTAARVLMVRGDGLEIEQGNSMGDAEPPGLPRDRNATPRHARTGRRPARCAGRRRNRGCGVSVTRQSPMPHRRVNGSSALAAKPVRTCSASPEPPVIHSGNRMAFHFSPRRVAVAASASLSHGTCPRIP